MVSEDLQTILDGTLEEGLARSAWEGKAPAIEQFGMQVMHKSPPLFRIPNFLTPDECDMLIHEAIATGEEATEYLNARVNSEVKGRGAGTMPEHATGYSAEAANEAVEWSAGATSGLRRRLSRDALRMLDARVLAVLVSLPPCLPPFVSFFLPPSPSPHPPTFAFSRSLPLSRPRFHLLSPHA